MRTISKPNMIRVLLASCGATLLPAAPALGQTGLDEALVSSTQLSGSQTSSVQAYAQAVAQGLTGSDLEGTRRARDLATEPLEFGAVSVDFRIRYSEALMPTLRQMLAGADQRKRLLAVRLAGDLATEDSADLVSDLFGARTEAERYMAVASAGRIFRTADTQAAAIRESRLESFVSELGELITGEASGAVVDAAARALLDAVNADSEVFGAAGPAAEATLLVSLSDRVRSGEGDAMLMSAVARTLNAMQNRIGFGEGVADQQVRDAAALAGDAVAMLLKSPAVSGDDLETAIALAGSADALIVFATEALDPNTVVSPAGLAAAMESGNLAGAAGRVIGPRGILVQGPHGLDAARFE